MPEIIVDFVAQKNQVGFCLHFWSWFHWMKITNRLKNHFLKSWRNLTILNIKETFQIFVVFRSKYNLQTFHYCTVSFKNGKIHHSFFMPVYISKKISFFIASGQKCFVIKEIFLSKILVAVFYKWIFLLSLYHDFV